MRTLFVLLALSSLSFAVPAAAMTLADPDPGQAATPATPAQPQTLASDRQVDDQVLGAIAGGDDVSTLLMTAQAKQTSTVSNNTITGDSVTGTITLDGAAFQNLSGFAVINANTGNDVSFNASLQVNLSINRP